MRAENALRERLSGLATAAGLSAPPLEENGDREPVLPAEVRGHAPDERIVVAPSLFEADAGEQTWHLATCLGWWASPVPRRRRRQGWAAGALLFVAQAALGLAELGEVIDLPRGGFLAVVVVSGALLLPLQPAMARREQRALDEAGFAVMTASGHTPGTLARQVFGGRREPPRFRRFLSAEPAPSRRIAAAERWRSRPHDALH